MNKYIFFIIFFKLSCKDTENWLKKRNFAENFCFMKKLLILISGLLLLNGCKKDDPVEQPANDVHTVLVYISGENSLSNMIQYGITNLKEGSKKIGDNNLIVYVDGADKSTTPYMARIKNGEIVDKVDMDESLASSPTVFRSVLEQAFSKYPAKDYGLVLWGHCSGWNISNDTLAYASTITTRTAKPRRAYGIDSGNNSTSDNGIWINFPTIKNILKDSGHKLRFVFGDCCNMQCLETAYELREVCDYMIGSPAEIPGQGAPYATLTPAMFSDDAKFYEQIVDAYFAQVITQKRVPFSVVKCSEMDNLANATKTVLKTFVPQSDTFMDLQGLIYYYRTSVSRYYYDANDFIKANAATAEYANWKQALDRAVVYKKFTDSWITNRDWDTYYGEFTMTEDKYSGVTMYIPQSTSSAYNNLIKKMGWYYAAGYNEVGW